MVQRVITGVLLTAFLVIMLIVPGWCMAIALMVFASFCVWEEYHALTLAGHKVVSWPTWVAMFASIPLGLIFGHKTMVPLVCTALLAMVLEILWREKPDLIDLSLSALPLLTVLLPFLSMVATSLVEPKGLEVTLLLLIYAVPLLGDTMAFFVGRAVGGRKLCPAVSPKKTVAGSLGGIGGSILAAMLICAISRGVCAPETCLLLPEWWGCLILGLLGGVVGQAGDLFASLVKRHSGIKDFSNLFPGHGGALDRLDSVMFMSVLVYCYRLFC